ncbi:MAG: tetratricopeptide repeat protein, partial [Planctomycetota bacterium]|nr:tetratricopeptide repeat protein [Planctomycetota bacterium]
MANEIQETAELPEPVAAYTQPVSTPSFDLLGIEDPSFPQLDMGRAEVYASQGSLRSFTKLVDGLEDSGDAGMRKGLGLWMLARHEEAVERLEAHKDDDVVAFTLARALCSCGRWADAQAIYAALTDKYPNERRPRCGMVEAELEKNLAEGNYEAAVEGLRAGLEAAPEAFEKSPEQRYLTGRAHELEREWEEALDAYASARELDPANRENLFRLAHLAERCGLDELALECYETLAGMLPIDTTVLLNLGVLYEDLGRDQDAAACYETVT